MSCFNVQGVQPQVLHTGKRYVFVSEEFTAFGASHDHIAGQMGRTARTVQRRLSNSYRSGRGVGSVEKKQLAQRQSIQPQDWNSLAGQLYDAGLYEQEKEVRRYFNVQDSTFRPKCNLYSSSLSVESKKHWRKSLAGTLIKDRT